VIPRIFADRPAGGTIREWVCGCSTGEEAYSIAILIQEHMETLRRAFRVQVFATDIDNQAIEKARGGIFPASIAADVSPERLERFFSQGPDGAYRIHKIIRDLLVFSVQDVIKDPPFSKLDLISCRNLLIYMSGALQKKLIPLFHYALNPEGVLFLGTSESVGEFSALFAALDRKLKLYLHQADVPGAVRPALGELAPPLWAGGTRSHPHPEEGPGKDLVSFRDLTEQALLQHYVQAGLLINGRGEILHIYGRTGRYLEPAPGDAGMNILPMARVGLRRELTTALHRVVTHKEPVHFSGLRVRTNGESIAVKLTVQPVASDADGTVMPDTFLVILEEASPANADLPGEDAVPRDKSIDCRIAALEQELRAKEEYLQTTIEELETSNEELRATNEEMQSVNEELQSTNEELETSKEELQSVNEELATVNAELQAKVSDLSRSNNDMNNLLAGTGVGTLFVDLQLRISRFTPAATPLINLIPTDVGRPVGHIASNLVGYDRLVEDVRAVLDSLVPLETEVQTTTGDWYQLRIRPYRTVDNVIEGAVITFVDITRSKKVEEALREARELAESIVTTVREPLVVLDEHLQVVSANQAFYSTFRVEPGGTLGQVLYELGNGQWDIPALRQLMEEILPQNATFDDFEVTHEFEQIGRRTMLLNARRILSEAGHPRLILLAIEDTTERPRAEETRS
jgi:two-component system CheB/CheR fusion protein